MANPTRDEILLREELYRLAYQHRASHIDQRRQSIFKRDGHGWQELKVGEVEWKRWHQAYPPMSTEVV
jgi:hypothetical protein